MAITGRKTEILLHESNDFFGLKKDKIFNHHASDWNIVTLKVANPIKLEMDQNTFYTDMKVYITDDIEQLEKLVTWSKTLTENVNSHVKNLKAKQEVEEEV